MLRLIAKYRDQVDKMTRRQAVLGLALGFFVVVMAVTGFLGPVTYPAGDLRNEYWFKAATVIFLTFCSVWVIVPSLLRLARR